MEVGDDVCLVDMDVIEETERQGCREFVFVHDSLLPPFFLFLFLFLLLFPFRFQVRSLFSFRLLIGLALVSSF